ncbi:hypothetical protein DFH07DRAFT_771426 [Mycena maculata]|uniref:Uncharacterized protein n=1 Tax=Mycena maculata TaxID=230809 RepID=A0AAD7JFA5_9AGAR|nr:hypothetical protein DFH07DRAFT_771426 [Mycena maculata]
MGLLNFWRDLSSSSLSAIDVFGSFCEHALLSPRYWFGLLHAEALVDARVRWGCSLAQVDACWHLLSSQTSYTQVATGRWVGASRGALTLTVLADSSAQAVQDELWRNRRYGGLWVGLTRVTLHGPSALVFYQQQLVAASAKQTSLRPPPHPTSQCRKLHMPINMCLLRLRATAWRPLAQETLAVPRSLGRITARKLVGRGLDLLAPKHLCGNAGTDNILPGMMLAFLIEEGAVSTSQFAWCKSPRVHLYQPWDYVHTGLVTQELANKVHMAKVFIRALYGVSTASSRRHSTLAGYLKIDLTFSKPSHTDTIYKIASDFQLNSQSGIIFILGQIAMLLDTTLGYRKYGLDVDVFGASHLLRKAQVILARWSALAYMNAPDVPYKEKTHVSNDCSEDADVEPDEVRRVSRYGECGWGVR